MSIDAELRLAELEAEIKLHRKAVNDYAIRTKAILKQQGFEPDLFAELSPALAIAAIAFRVV